MIFRPDLADAVMAGRKTETRRPVKPGLPCRYSPHHVYAVQNGRGRPALGRIEVLGVDREPVGAITDTGALAEGFPSRAAFLACWADIYGLVRETAPVWVIRFRVYSRARPC